MILGVGNLLLSDEGFGVHFVRNLERNYQFPDEVELCDVGTLGLLATHKLEDAERVYLVDALALDGEPGEWRRYRKDDFLAGRVPAQLSPHQAGVREMLVVSELRGCCPAEVHLIGVIPASLAPGCGLSPVLAEQCDRLGEELVAELRTQGLAVLPRALPG